MINKSNAVILCVGLIGLGCCIGIGLIKLGNQVNSMNNKMIEVKGLSEKIVKADLGKIVITISNEGSYLEDLYKKRIKDKNKVLDCLKKIGITDEEIADNSSDTWDYEKEVKITEKGVTQSEYKRVFKADDSITIKTKFLEKIDKIRSEIMQLNSEGIFVKCNHSYQLTDFIKIKLDMMKEASQNARKNAEVFVESQGYKIDDVLYLKQGEVTITGDDEKEGIESWRSNEAKSINKKLRLVVRGGFSKKKACSTNCK